MQYRFEKHNGLKIMLIANAIIGQLGVYIPPVPDPGRALLFLGLHKSKLAGKDVQLDYRVYDDRWKELRNGSSTFPGDLLPFRIIATDCGAIEIVENDELLEDLLPCLAELFHEQSPLLCEAPENFSVENHATLCRIAVYVKQPFSRVDLSDRLKLETSAGHPVEICRSHVNEWLKSLVQRHILCKAGTGRATRYQISSNSKPGPFS